MLGLALTGALLMGAPAEAAAAPAEVTVSAPAPVLPVRPSYAVAVGARPPPPPSGAGRFVGGPVLLVAGLGLLTAATFEYAGSRDGTKLLIGQVPAGVVMLVAGSTMIATGARDQLRLSTWEARAGMHARPSGNGLIVGGVTAMSLGALAAGATAIAQDLRLDAPRSIPAGWATAAAGLGGGAALLIAGAIRRTRYGAWRERVTGLPVPTISPTRAGAQVGVVGQF